MTRGSVLLRLHRVSIQKGSLAAQNNAPGSPAPQSHPTDPKVDSRPSASGQKSGGGGGAAAATGSTLEDEMARKLSIAAAAAAAEVDIPSVYHGLLEHELAFQARTHRLLRSLTMSACQLCDHHCPPFACLNSRFSPSVFPSSFCPSPTCTPPASRFSSRRPKSI